MMKIPKIKISEFIGSFLSWQSPDLIKVVGASCCVCGESKNRLFIEKKKFFSSNFNDNSMLKFDSNYLCEYCAKCFANSFDGKSLRSFSYYVNDSGITVLDRNSIADSIRREKSGPFVIAVTFSHKKHAWFNCEINEPGRDVIVGTDIGQIRLNSKHLKIYELCQELRDYGFYVSEIDQLNSKRQSIVESYGIDKLIEKFETIKPYAGTLPFRLILHILKSKEKNDDKD